jgi:protein phosphatase PTC1
MVVRFDNGAIRQHKNNASIGVEGDEDTGKGGISEADALVEEAKKHLDSGDVKETVEEEDEEDIQTRGVEDIKLDPEVPKAKVKNPS